MYIDSAYIILDKESTRSRRIDESQVVGRGLDNPNWFSLLLAPTTLATMRPPPTLVSATLVPATLVPATLVPATLVPATLVPIVPMLALTAAPTLVLTLSPTLANDCSRLNCTVYRSPISS